MARNITPTNEEAVLNVSDFIVSKTNSKGILSYCNQIFIEMSGYNESELLGVNHNIIRHPDMPKVAFKVAWDFIQSGKEFFGFVKNLRQNGGYYWVFTNITPDYDTNGKIIGYTSIRRKPNPEALKTIIPLYNQLVSIEQSKGVNGSQDAILSLLKDKNMDYNELIIALQGDY